MLSSFSNAGHLVNLSIQRYYKYGNCMNISALRNVAKLVYIWSSKDKKREVPLLLVKCSNEVIKLFGLVAFVLVLYPSYHR